MEKEIIGCPVTLQVRYVVVVDDDLKEIIQLHV
jgi:hypothetical protein